MSDSKLRLFAKCDIHVVESIIKAGDEVRIGKISPSGSKFMVICKNDNLHKWLDLKDYDTYIEDRLVMSEPKYNRAFIRTKHLSCPEIRELLANTGDEDLKYWVVDSKESFHGQHDDTYFYFKDNRIPAHTKLPLSCLELEFTQEELES